MGLVLEEIMDQGIKETETLTVLDYRLEQVLLAAGFHWTNWARVME